MLLITQEGKDHKITLSVWIGSHSSIHTNVSMDHCYIDAFIFFGIMKLSKS